MKVGKTAFSQKKASSRVGLLRMRKTVRPHSDMERRNNVKMQLIGLRGLLRRTG